MLWATISWWKHIPTTTLQDHITARCHRTSIICVSSKFVDLNTWFLKILKSSFWFTVKACYYLASWNQGDFDKAARYYMASVKEINRPQDFVLPYYGTWLLDSTAVLEIWFFFRLCLSIFFLCISIFFYEEVDFYLWSIQVL